MCACTIFAAILIIYHRYRWFQRGLTISISVASAGVGAVSGGITVMESSKMGGLVTSDCDSNASSLLELRNSHEDLIVCLALMNSVSWIVRSHVIRIDLVSGWYT